MSPRKGFYFDFEFSLRLGIGANIGYDRLCKDFCISIKIIFLDVYVGYQGDANVPVQ